MLLTLKQAAAEAQTSVKTLRRLIQAGRLKAIDYGTKGGRHDYRVAPEALANVLPAPEPQARVRRRRSVAPALQSFLPRV